MNSRYANGRSKSGQLWGPKHESKPNSSQDMIKKVPSKFQDKSRSKSAQRSQNTTSDFRLPSEQSTAECLGCRPSDGWTAAGPSQTADRQFQQVLPGWPLTSQKPQSAIWQKVTFWRPFLTLIGATTWWGYKSGGPWAAFQASIINWQPIANSCSSRHLEALLLNLPRGNSAPNLFNLSKQQQQGT